MTGSRLHTRATARRRLLAVAALALASLAPTTARAQSVLQGFTWTPSPQPFSSPTGADFESGSIVTSSSYQVDCKQAHCTVSIYMAGGSAPAGATTALQYSLDGVTWLAIPTSVGTAVQVCRTTSNANSTVGTCPVLRLRYPLGWAGPNFAPPGAYSAPVSFLLKHNQV